MRFETHAETIATDGGRFVGSAVYRVTESWTAYVINGIFGIECGQLLIAPNMEEAVRHAESVISRWETRGKLLGGIE